MPEPSNGRTMDLPLKRRNDAGPSTFERELERIHEETMHCTVLELGEIELYLLCPCSRFEGCQAAGRCVAQL